jgi:hypothetical protein
LKLGLVGPTNQERSLPFDAQRTVNLIPVANGTKEPSALYGTPGLLIFATCGNGGIRSTFTASNGRAFAVSGYNLYEVDEDGNETVLGTLDSNVSFCTVADNGFQLAICDGTDLYILTYATDLFEKVSDSDFPGAGTICFLDGYFIVNDPDTGQFYISGLYDGLTWDALDFATAEGLPDNIVRVFATNQLLILMGEVTTEFWTNSGGTDFPFVRSARIDTGCASPHSVVSLDNSVFWVGRDDKGQGVVYKMQGSTPVRVSTHAIERMIQACTDLTVLRAFPYQEDGRAFYFLTGGDLETSVVFDVETGLWHERAYLNSFGNFEQHRAATAMFAFGKVLVGDKTNGKIYHMSSDYYDDNGDAIKRTRIFSHVFNEGQVLRANALQIDFERGVGLSSGQGSDPQAWIRVSRDFGQTWGPELYKSIGAIGNRLPRCVWRRLGLHEAFTVELNISDPVKVAICGAYLQ